MDGVVIKEPTAEEIYRDIQYKLNSKMVSNPKFKELFLKEVNYIYEYQDCDCTVDRCTVEE